MSEKVDHRIERAVWQQHVVETERQVERSKERKDHEGANKPAIADLPHQDVGKGKAKDQVEERREGRQPQRGVHVRHVPVPDLPVVVGRVHRMVQEKGRLLGEADQNDVPEWDEGKDDRNEYRWRQQSVPEQPAMQARLTGRRRKRRKLSIRGNEYRFTHRAKSSQCARGSGAVSAPEPRRWVVGALA